MVRGVCPTLTDLALRLAIERIPSPADKLKVIGDQAHQGLGFDVTRGAARAAHAHQKLRTALWRQIAGAKLCTRLKTLRDRFPAQPSA